MKYLYAILLFFISNSVAQINQGNFMIGGNGFVNMGQDKIRSKYYDKAYYRNNQTMILESRNGYFVFNKLAIGISPGFNYNFTEFDGPVMEYYCNKTYTISIGPFVRYYLFNSKFTPFIECEYSFNFDKKEHTSTSINQEKFTYNIENLRHQINISIGFSYLITESIGAEILFGYNYESTNYHVNSMETDIISNSMTILIGFQKYL